MEDGADYGQSLKQAQELGYAEANPAFDVSGKDAGQKLLLLASLAFGVRLSMNDIQLEGIESVTATDFAYAREFGCTIRLLATARLENEALSLDVRPTLVPARHAALRDFGGAFNAVELRAFALGPAMLVGQGAGALPTGTAVVSDIIEAGKEPRFARRRARSTHGLVRGRSQRPTGRSSKPQRSVVPALPRRRHARRPRTDCRSTRQPAVSASPQCSSANRRREPKRSP